jgi:hypothetical protein
MKKIEKWVIIDYYKNELESNKLFDSENDAKKWWKVKEINLMNEKVVYNNLKIFKKIKI